MLSYYHCDRYCALDKLALSLSLWMLCCWNVNVNDQSGNALNKRYHDRLTITAIMGIVAQAIFLLRSLRVRANCRNIDI